MHLIIDADPIVYRCGFAAQRSEYHLTVEHPSGEVGEAHFAPGEKKTAGAKMKEWMDANPDLTLLEKDHIVIPEPEGNALEAVRTQLYSIELECRNRFGVQEFSSISVILSGPGNYREQIATIFPYKGNRDPDHKPHWYQSIRNYLTSDWGAVVVHGREADDECSILAHKYRLAGLDYVVATIDKDLEQIPGLHYNYLKQVHYAQSEYDAERWFWTQALSGDPTDGIPGCYRLGAIRAERIIRDRFPPVVGLPVAGVRLRGLSADSHSGRSSSDLGKPNRDSRSAVWAGICSEYRASQERAGCPYLGRDPVAVALETARLVYLQQAEGELWIPEGPPHLQLETDE